MVLVRFAAWGLGSMKDFFQLKNGEASRSENRNKQSLIHDHVA
jgi:hypothetical protein